MSETGENINMTDDTEGHVVRNVDEEGVEAVEAEGADDPDELRLM